MEWGLVTAVRGCHRVVFCHNLLWDFGSENVGKQIHNNAFAAYGTLGLGMLCLHAKRLHGINDFQQ